MVYSSLNPMRSLLNSTLGLTEEQIIDIFSSVGQKPKFRLVHDRETGRPKGFGFAEFTDSDLAASAVRNLNDFEIMNRKLRVDFSNDGGDQGGDDNTTHTSYQPPSHMSGGPPLQNGSSIPPLPPGTDLPPGLTCPDAISRTLNTLPPAQLIDVLTQMKSLVATDPSKATELLRQAPQLSYAIFQALLLMGLVSTDALTSVVEGASAPAPAPAPVAIQPPHGYPPVPVPGQGAYPPGFPPPPLHMVGTPVGGLPYQPPPMPQYQQPPPVAAPPAAAASDTDALMAQVMAMPQSLIDQLPPAERAQLMALRAQFGGGAR
jgi:cleavage stimulation factor subunit 2